MATTSQLASFDCAVQKIEDRTAIIGVIGLGYVGIPLAISVIDQGLSVLGFDILDERVTELNRGESPIKHVSREKVLQARDAGFEATTDFSRASQCDALIICVPTPLNKGREPELKFVIDTMDTLTPHLRPGQVLSLESTTWPGTTEEILLPYILKRGLQPGDDFFLIYSAEREDPGNIHFNTAKVPKVVGGHSKACLDVGVALYGAFIEQIVPISSTRAAEMVKLLENIHRSVNIGLINEMKVVADAMGLDIFEIIAAAKTKPFGFTAFYPGPGVGGHCIPIDPFYLTWKAREYGLHTRFVELAGEVNAAMPQYVVDKLIRALNDSGKPLNGAKILVLGIAYKRNVDDVRESPSVFVMERLRDWGAKIQYSDPHVPVFPDMREHNFDLKSVPLTPRSLSEQDAVILLTDHSDFDYELIRRHSAILVDTRGRFPKDNGVVRA